LARHIVNLVEEKKGEDVLLLDITNLNTFTDYFIFCSGNSDRQLRALQQDIVKSVKHEFSVLPWSNEGDEDAEWMLVDYGDVIVNIMSPEKRRFYDLEGFWKEGKVLIHIQ
jgi:ribosome-associated protein